MKLSNGLDVSANEWFVFGRCVQLVEASESFRRYGFYPAAVFPGRSTVDRAGRALIDRLVALGLLEHNGLAGSGHFISDMGWEAWRTK